MSWLREFSRAREEFMTSPEPGPTSTDLIRPTVYESWRRSRLQGLRPEAVEPRYLTEVDLDTYLVRAVSPIVNRRGVALEHGAYALALADRDGCLLRRWVREPGLASAMDALGVGPGSTMDESTVGTTALVAMHTGNPEMIKGPEHFSDKLSGFSCSSAPIVHPVNQRLLGSVSLICRYRDTAPIMLPWVAEIVAAVEETLRQKASVREQQLFDAYSLHNRDVRRPVVALDSRTIITNAAAARLLGGVDQSLLWEHARRSLVDRATGPTNFTLPNGQVLTVECRAVSHDAHDAGAVLVLGAQPPRIAERAPATGEPAALPPLVGRSVRWRALCRQARGLVGGRSPVLVVGEPGTGRLSVALALEEGHDVRVVDAADAVARGVKRWCRELEFPDGAVVIRHAELLDPSFALATLATVRRVPPKRLLATADGTALAEGDHNAVLDAFTTVLEVPALRDRLDDFADLVAVFSDRATEGGSMQWTPQVIQTLSRMEWPGNLVSLDALIRRLVTDRPDGSVIAVEHLPPECRARGSRRPLIGLEQTEAHAIMNALRAAGGNKNQAALALGIARSTLYRKVRALGLDLSSTVY